MVQFVRQQLRADTGAGTCQSVDRIAMGQLLFGGVISISASRQTEHSRRPHIGIMLGITGRASYGVRSEKLPQTPLEHNACQNPSASRAWSVRPS